MEKKKNLGKGLAELLRDTGTIIPDSLSSVELVKPEQLRSNQYQPRKNFDKQSIESLANSIKENGILQPILVKKAQNTGEYQIIAGERRWRAAILAKLDKIPIIVHQLSDTLALQYALLENIQREDLNPLEEADGYSRLIDEFKYTQEQIAKFSGKSRSHIANTLRLQSLPERVKQYVNDKLLSAGHARQLIGRIDAEELADKIVEEGLSVRQIETLARHPHQIKSIRQNRKKILADPELEELQDKVTHILDAEVKITLSNNKGSGIIQIKFSTLAKLDDIVRKLSI